MRSLLRSGLLLSGLGLGLSVLAGCWRTTRADFPRPPATASTPVGEDLPEPETPEETRLAEEPVLEVEPEPAVEEPEPRADEGPKSAPPAPPPPDPPDQAPEPPPRERAGSEGLDPELLTKLERASSLMSSLSTRELSDGQREQFAAARGFVAQAQRALDEGDERRALLLIDKGLILAEDVERSSRP